VPQRWLAVAHRRANLVGDVLVGGVLVGGVLVGGVLVSGVLVSGVLVAVSTVVGAQPSLPPLPSIQGRPIVLSAGELAALVRGEPAIQLLETRDPRVVAVFGIVAVNVPRSFFVSRFSDVAQSLRAAGRTQFGVFGTPTTPADAASLVVPAGDVAALRACRPGSCEFKLPASDMAQIRTVLDNAGAAGPVEVSRYARRRVVEYVNAYRERGDTVMVVYDDYGAAGVRASEAFASLLAGTTYLSQYAPALHQHLSGALRRRPDGATEVIYWMRDEMPGMRATLSINQLTVYSPPARPQLTVATTKQLFANHYFEGAFDLLVAAARADVPRGEGIYLMLLRQDRFDHLPSGGLLNIRGRVRRRLSERTDAELRRLRTEYQAAWARRRP
jgi:hypothetical protein